MKPRSEPEPATRIFRDRTGAIRTLDIRLVYSPIPQLDAAIQKARLGKTVFVAREDVPAILAALGVA